MSFIKVSKSSVYCPFKFKRNDLDTQAPLLQSQSLLTLLVLLLVDCQITNGLAAAWAYRSTRSRYNGRENTRLVFLDFSVRFSSSSQPPSFLTGTTWLLQRAVTTAKTAGQLKDRRPTEWPRWVGFVWAALEISIKIHWTLSAPLSCWLN